MEGRNKLSLSASDMFIYVENMKESTEKIKIKILLELKSNYSKVAGYKVNMQKSFTFLYISNEQVEFEFKNMLALTLVSLKWNSYKCNKICTKSIWGNMSKIKNWIKYMERYFMFIDDETQYCQVFSYLHLVLYLMWSQTKSQQVMLWILTNWTGSLYEEVKQPE